MGEVIALPLVQREPSCFICVNAIVGDQTYCTVFHELIIDESTAAADCDVYEDDERKS